MSFRLQATKNTAPHLLIQHDSTIQGVQPMACPFLIPNLEWHSGTLLITLDLSVSELLQQLRAFDCFWIIVISETPDFRGLVAF